MQIQQARAHIMATLASGESPRADADALLCHLLDCRRSYLMTWPEHELDAAQQATDALSEARLAAATLVERETYTVRVRDARSPQQ